MAIIKRLVASTKPDLSKAESAPSTNSPAEMDEPAAKKKPDLYQEVTDRICEAIENGTAPWQRSWDASLRWPVSAITGKRYHGINVLTLLAAGYQDNRWATFHAGKQKKWFVNKGEKSSRIYFYKTLVKETGELDPETGQPETIGIPFLRSSVMFNLSQMNGAPAMEFQNEHRTEMTDVTEALCREIIEASGAVIEHGTRRAAYSPSRDTIYMPERESFESDAAYYSVLLHEIGHWSGHESRMNREFGASRDSIEYAREELRAEIASAMMGLRLGLPSAIEGHAGYVEHYLKILKEDKKEIFRAAKDAEQIMRFVLAHNPEFREEFEREHAEQMAAAIAAGGPEEIFDASEFDFEPEEELAVCRP